MKSVALLIASTMYRKVSLPCNKGSAGQGIVPVMYLCHLDRAGAVMGIPEIFGFNKPHDIGPSAPSTFFLFVKTMDCHFATASAKLLSSVGCAIPIEEK